MAAIGFFLQRRLINERLAKNVSDWTHSGSRVDLTVKIAATSAKTRVALAEHMARPPLSLKSLKKMLVEEQGGSVLYGSEYNPYFRTNLKLFPAIEFVVDLLRHLPDAGAHLLPWATAERSPARARRYGLYPFPSRRSLRPLGPARPSPPSQHNPRSLTKRGPSDIPATRAEDFSSSVLIAFVSALFCPFSY